MRRAAAEAARRPISLARARSVHAQPRAAFAAAAEAAAAEAAAAAALEAARPISLALARSVHAQPRAAFAAARAPPATAEAAAEAARRPISLDRERSVHAQPRTAWWAEVMAPVMASADAAAEAAQAALKEDEEEEAEAAAAARRRISLALARSVHAQPSAGPERPALQAVWVPLYLRLSALPPDAPSGSVAAELDDWLRSRRPLSEEQLLAYVRKPCKFRHHKRALELMDWMEARGVNLQLRHHAIRVDLVSVVNGIQAAEEYFWNLPDIFKSIETYSSLLSCYAEHRKLDKGLELYENMKAMNIVSNTLVYNNLMALYLKKGRPEKIPTTFEEMQEGGIRADNFTYYVLTESYIMMNDLESAENVLEELQKATSVHWSLYTMMANNYNKRGQFDKAELTLKKAEEVMDKRVMLPWQDLLSLYASSGNLSEVKRIWESLKLAFKKCSNRSYLAMLSALRTLDDFDSLQKIFQEWVSTHEQYDMRISNVVIKAYLDKGMIDEAELLWEKAKEKGADFNSKTCELFLDHYMGAGDMKSALNWVENMTKFPKKAGKLDREKICKFFEEHKDVEGAEWFCKCLRTLGCIDGKAYESLLRTYLAAGKTNRSLRQQIKEDKIKISNDIGNLLKRMREMGDKLSGPEGSEANEDS